MGREQRGPALRVRFPVGTPRAVVGDAYRGRGYVESSSEQRPSDGWPSHGHSWFVEAARRREERTGRAPYRIEHYDKVGGFYSVTLDWFYYDESDGLVAADSTYFSD